MSTIKSEKIAINGMLLTTALLWGSSYAVRKIGLETMEPFFFNGLRFLTAFIFVFLFYFFEQKHAAKRHAESIDAQTAGNEERGAKDAPDAELKPISYQIFGGIVVGIFLSLGANIQQWGIVLTNASKVGFITSLYIIFIPLISWIFLKHTIKPKIWAGAVMACTGLALISISPGGNFQLNVGDVAIFICAVFFAIQMIFVGHFVRYSNPLLLVAVQMLTGAITSFLFSLLFEHGNTLAGVIAGAWTILFTGLFSLGVANILQFYAQKKASPSIAAIVLSLESVFGAIFGMIMLGERLGFIQIIGCIIIFLAVLMTQYERKPVLKKG